VCSGPVPPGPAVADTGSSCPVEGWCWVNPLPQGNSLRGVWAAGPTDAWAVGAAGTIVHWDGVRWSLSASGTTEYLVAVWGSSARDVWAVGLGGTIVHWDGARWSSVASGTTYDLVDLSGSGPDDVWALGSIDRSPVTTGTNQPPTVHWDGKSWSPVDFAATSIWANGADDVWALAGDVVLHWDGARWSEITRLDVGNQPLTGIWASGPHDVRVYGDQHQFHFDGQTWAPDDLGPMASISHMAGTGPSDVWAVGSFLGPEAVDVVHFDGASWAKATDRVAHLDGVSATGPADAWAVGPSGQIQRWDGRAWTLADDDLTAVSPTSDGGSGGVVWGSGPNDVWAVASAGMIHWDGRTWSSAVPQPSVPVRGLSLQVSGLWGTGPDDVWAVGLDVNQRAIFHWDGKAWTTVLRGGTADDRSFLSAVWGSGPRDVWAVGRAPFSQALLYHWDGAMWSLDDTMNGAPTSVWGSGPNDVWVAGQATLLHFDGKAWSSLMNDSHASLGPVWGTSAHDVWLAEDDLFSGALHHWNGSSWALVTDGPKQVIRSFWGAAADDVWALEALHADGTPRDNLEILHFDGKTWTAAAPRLSGLEMVVLALWGSGPGDVWAVGVNAILHHAGR
jgi:hypothetical protein